MVNFGAALAFDMIDGKELQTKSFWSLLLPTKSNKSEGIRSYAIAIIAVSAATLVAVIADKRVHNANLVLLYVLAVVAVGLRRGSGAAIAAALLSFLSFNFFLTEPRYTFAVAQQEDLSTLIFLLLIALLCGPVASRIRHQFILLHNANKYSEAMGKLGHALSVAENTEAVWKAVIDVIAATTSAQVAMAIFTEDDDASILPTSAAPLLAATDMQAIEWSRCHRQISGLSTEVLPSANWTVYPVVNADRCLACAIIRFNGDQFTALPHFRDLINEMLRQAADTWQRIKLVDDLETAHVKAEVEQLRSALLSSVSHDLKSPLSAMMGAAESLKLLGNQLSEGDRIQLVDTILQESHRLDSYIQNLLDMTRLGYGNLKIERDWVSPADIIGSALTRLKRYHPEIKTTTAIADEPRLLYVHAALVEQALFNILENAVRFSPVGEAITISSTAMNGEFTLCVDDRGPGIPAALREKIFDMFYAVSEGDHKSSGLGMGLAICRSMIGAHGGSVTATVGGNNMGTRMIITLPIEPAATEEDAEDSV